MEVIHGVELLRHEAFRDERSELVAFEQFTNLPFPLKRVFFIALDAAGAARGGHANSCHEWLVALSGSLWIEIDNGVQTAELCLDTREKALWIKPGVVIRLRSLAPQTIVLAIASERYVDTRHYDDPQPQLTEGQA